jgi:hypothetical protein
LKISLHFKPWLRVLFITALFVFGYVTPKYLFWFPLSIQAGACATAFIYVGYLIRMHIDEIKKATVPVMILGFIFSLYVWIRFISEFQSFWLVHSDMGRGLIDVVGSVCGCICVMFISWFIAKYIPLLPKLLGFIGKYSLLFLCIHLVELDMFPWGKLVSHISNGRTQYLTFMLIGKIVMDILLLFLLTKIKPFMKLMGYKVSSKKQEVR